MLPLSKKKKKKKGESLKFSEEESYCGEEVSKLRSERKKEKIHRQIFLPGDERERERERERVVWGVGGGLGSDIRNPNKLC